MNHHLNITTKTCRQVFSLFLIPLLSCHQTNQKMAIAKVDTVYKHDTVYLSETEKDWQANFGLTHDPAKDSIAGKPVSYYLDDKECPQIAYEFYYGYFRPSDDGATDELLKYAVTDNNKLRPFLRWCLDRTINISDGALAEQVGQPARRYAEKFPEEFFIYMDSDTTNQRYKNWVEAISYSGFYEREDWTNDKKIRTRMINSMKRNCKKMNATIETRINAFTAACFKEKTD